MVKGGDVHSVLSHLIKKNLRPDVQTQVDEIRLYNPNRGRESELIEHNKINKIKSILDQGNTTSAQLFETGEEDNFRAVLFNHLFKQLKRIVERRPAAGQLDAFGQDHWTGIMHDIKNSEIIDDLETYGYGWGEFEDNKFTDKFKAEFRTEPHNESEQRMSDSEYPIYLAPGEKLLPTSDDEDEEDM